MPPADAEMHAALAAAPDAKLGRIVGMLDSLAARGTADALLDAARPRLRVLRPARPLRFTRLLALPLEPLLVGTADWDGTPRLIPRAALTPLSQAMQAALGETAERIEAAALGHSMAEEALVARLGAELWPLAAKAPLPDPPPGWEEAGLAPASAAPLIALARVLWRRGDQPVVGG